MSPAPKFRISEQVNDKPSRSYFSAQTPEDYAMDNLVRHYWSRMPCAENIIVGIIGLGPGGRELAEQISHHYPVYAFDHALRGPQDPSRSIRWTWNPSDLEVATHLIIADPATHKYTGNTEDGRISDLLWAVSIVRAAVHGRKDVTIIMASVVPAQGTTEMLLGEFHMQGHRVCIAPQLPWAHASDDSCDFLPKVVSGIDELSRFSVWSFYRSIFGEKNVDLFREISSVELLKDSGTYISALIGASDQRVKELRERYRNVEVEEGFADDEGSDDLESLDEGDESDAATELATDSDESRIPSDDENSDGREDSADSGDADRIDKLTAAGKQPHKPSQGHNPGQQREHAELSRKLISALALKIADVAESRK
ncbi:hypothetical protein H2200_002739 [Cladophialophora chaetospira]|uniref:Uncharacterized protein n=1 Tax=Cladophialophora chaetospira TaxID=386627 RepID=A0AA39CNC3_9EURO|nr:hypothetical protein H2200_002739 [Cladophialophora chaetospira]